MNAVKKKDAQQYDDDGHPYGVEPLGNIFLGRSSNCRPRGLGTLAVFDDERMLDLMGFASARCLGRLACVSRALYVFAHVNDLWKGLVMQEMARRPGQAVQTSGAFWKTTLQHINATPCGGVADGGSAPRAPHVPHIPLKVSGFFSDLLFQPHHCATAAIKPEWVERSTVDRRKGLSPTNFRKLYEEPNKPVVLTDAAASWPALREWTRDKLLMAHGGLRLHAGGLEFALKDYLVYAEESKDELPLYVFDKRFADKCADLGEEYSVPEVFSEDLFSVLGKERRPDHRWLIAGPARSGSSFHVDPNCTSAWNATVSGKKKWIMFPPGETPPGVHPSEDGLDLAAPVSITEWFLNFYEECHAPGRKSRPLECVVSAGEVVFVPMGWWHCVLNLEWSVAITQNFVSSVNLPHVISFLLTQKHLISGLPADERGDLGERFISALAAKHPELGAEEMAAAATAAAADGADGGAVDGDVTSAVGSFHAGKKLLRRRRGGDSKRPRLWEKLKAGVSSDVAAAATVGGCANDRVAGNGTGVGMGVGVHAVVGGKGGVDDGGGTGPGRGADLGGGGGFSFGFSFA
eukprot:jgi/Undpi1/1440/HiC_scaffold_11.g04831.m1